MIKPTSEILARIRKNSEEHSDGIYTRIYRYLLREDTYYTAYQKLYPNKGAGTKGVDDDTADGFGKEYIIQIIEELKNLTYEPKPVRRIQIPKANGKKRPLGIPTFRDKLVQEVIRQILEAVYEPLFSKHSHGFRPNRSCHTALKELNNEFTGTKWFVEGDIRGCFDNIKHEKLISLLSDKIKDSKFINLIRKFLKAGYLEKWKYNKTYSGTPQGGILSPILANIYLHELDKKVEKMQEGFYSKGGKVNPSYYEIKNQRAKLRKLYKKTGDKTILIKIRKLGVEQRRTPCTMPTDKKIAYVRYADDFIVGIKGNRTDAEDIKQELKDFLLTNLKLELSEEKTKITHSAENARFLGYDISVRRNTKVKRTKTGIKKRTLNYMVQINIPLKEKIEQFLYKEKYAKQDKTGKLAPKSNSRHLYKTDLEILDTYNAITRGICNYYNIASNRNKLNYFFYIMEYSCLKTLANKHKTTISKIYQKYRVGKSWGIPYETKKGKKTKMILRLKDIKKEAKFYQDNDEIKIPHYLRQRSSLEQRLKAHRCELCGVEDDETRYEVHHVNKLKNLKGKESWEIAMIARKRKTLVVCHECHMKIHYAS